MKRQIAHVILTAGLALAPLAFSTGCAVAHHQETAGAYAKDKEIAASIKTKLYADRDVKGTEIKVTSLNGEVQLSGFVDSQQAKDRAGQIASETSGVVKVYNNLLLPTGR
jgi:osmotically-inducible protein OsmY